MFVDYCGQTMTVHDPVTGDAQEAQIFVACLGASNYTFAEATPAQTLPHWIGSHERALAFFGGVPKAIVPDNLKSGVTDPCRYEPGVNPSYHAFAEHYQVAILPARAKKPRDKSKVEKSGTGSGTSRLLLRCAISVSPVLPTSMPRFESAWNASIIG